MMSVKWKIGAMCATALGAGLMLAMSAVPAAAHDKDYVWPGYGGFSLYHNYNLSKHERPYHRHYYPRHWGGYAFSAPYFVTRHDYEKPVYERLNYGNKQKARWFRQHRHAEHADWGSW